MSDGFTSSCILPPPVGSASSVRLNEKVLEATNDVVREDDQLAAFAELREKASAGTLFVPHRLTEANSQEQEESDDDDDDLNDVS